jgi:hypothetical protein
MVSVIASGMPGKYGEMLQLFTQRHGVLGVSELSDSRRQVMCPDGRWRSSLRLFAPKYRRQCGARGAKFSDIGSAEIPRAVDNDGHLRTILDHQKRQTRCI